MTIRPGEEAAMARTGRILIGAALVGCTVAQVLGRTAGTTRAERRQPLPGDDVVPAPSVVTDHAASIAAAPGEVWPWLTQVGWHLGGWYTPRWVDRVLFPGNWSSLDHLDPDLVRDLRVGDRIPDGPPGTAWFEVVTVERPTTLVLHSTTHVPPGWTRRTGARVDWTWSFHLQPEQCRDGSEGTRVQLRVRGRTAPWWLTAGYVTAIVPADYVMAMGMLRGIKRRVEARPSARPSGRAPYAVAGRTGERRAGADPPGERGAGADPNLSRRS